MQDLFHLYVIMTEVPWTYDKNSVASTKEERYPEHNYPMNFVKQFSRIPLIWHWKDWTGARLLHIPDS